MSLHFSAKWSHQTDDWASCHLNNAFSWLLGLDLDLDLDLDHKISQVFEKKLLKGKFFNLNWGRAFITELFLSPFIILSLSFIGSTTTVRMFFFDFDNSCPHLCQMEWTESNKNTRSWDYVVAAVVATDVLSAAVQVDHTCDFSLWFD